MLEELKKVLIRKDGKINTKVLYSKKFRTTDLYKYLIDNTSFLDQQFSLSERLFCLLNSVKEQPKCIICGNKPIFYSLEKGFAKNCSDRSCAAKACANKRIETKIQKYGQKVSPKTIEACKKYGKLKAEKTRKVLQEKYGVTNPGQLPNHHEKVIRTLMSKYGVDHPSKIPVVIEHRKQKLLAAYQDKVNQFNININKITKRYDIIGYSYLIEYYCKNCNTLNSMNSVTFLWRIRNNQTPCTTCLPIISISTLQQEIIDYIKKYYQGEIITNNNTVISPYEIDLILPELKIGFEINGSYYHSIGTAHINDKHYHIRKTLLAREKGISLYHIFDYWWYDKNQIVKSKILSLLGQNQTIYGRNCTIKKVDKKTEKTFLKENHIQGYYRSDIAYGLFYDDQLVSLMSFGKPRYNKKYQYELIRYANKKFINVIGGASKLFKKFVREYQPKSVISYCDIALSPNGKLYKKLGFNFLRYSSPNYKYFKNGKVYSREQFQKHKLKTLLDNFDPNKTEIENMIENGFKIIYDCGNSVWLWES